MAEVNVKIGEVDVVQQLSAAELEKHFDALYIAAANDPTLSEDARALAREAQVFEIDRPDQVGVAELASVGIFIAKSAGGAVIGLTVKELWAYFKAKLQARQRTAIKDVRDADGGSDQT
ncbi:MAG: hypothetical protein AAF813_00730 [Pseudomonadota bacterium]